LTTSRPGKVKIPDMTRKFWKRNRAGSDSVNHQECIGRCNPGLCHCLSPQKVGLPADRYIRGGSIGGAVAEESAAGR